MVNKSINSVTVASGAQLETEYECGSSISFSKCAAKVCGKRKLKFLLVFPLI